MTRDLSRLLRPASIAVIGGGAWCRAVIAQCGKMGFAGQLFPVHPTARDIGGWPAFASVDALPGPVDAAFVGVNRRATVEVVGQLAATGAGGAVCFASGFAEAQAEDGEAADLQSALIRTAGDMPILGPNCYGVINALDGALLWPDQHGCAPVERGVAILTQSSNIAINLTMQRRGLPVAYVVTCGNQAQTGQAEIALALLDDPRVTAIGLHIEGFRDLRSWEALADKARARGVPLVALKVGRSVQARAATVTHTASLAGGDAGAQALLDRLGIARVRSLAAFLETLKLLHVAGSLPSGRIASISCSGGEASLIADTAQGTGLEFPPLNDRQSAELRQALGPMVALANPLDYNTYIWRDTEAMTRAWAAMTDPDLALTFLIVDYPRDDRCDAADWACATDAAIAARAATGANLAVVATLPELLPDPIAAQLMAGGVVPLNGLSEAIEAADAAAWLGRELAEAQPLLLPGPSRPARVLGEAQSKAMLAAAGVRIPKSERAASPQGAAEAAHRLGCVVALKGEGHAHKSEAGAVVLNLESPDDVAHAAFHMRSDTFLIEEMLTGGVAEVLVGVIRDPAHGFVLTLGAGGVMTEILADTQSLLVPASRASVAAALDRLKIAPLLRGYRGKRGANRAAILDAAEAVQAFVIEHADRIEEVEINPLICSPDRAVAADALIRMADD